MVLQLSWQRRAIGVVGREGYDAERPGLGAKAANDGARLEVSDGLQEHIGGAEQRIDWLAI